MKKLFFFGFIFFLTTILVSNYRIPFFKQNGGPWSIGFGSSLTYPNEINVAENIILPLENIKKVEDSTQFIADPFFLKVKDTFYIFFEHQKIIKNAEIGLLSSIDGINYKYRGTILKEKFHLSYPDVFEYKKEYYMIPECQASNNVLLYKSYNFPFNWKVCDTLLKNTKLKDPTIFLSDTLNIIVGSDDNLTMHLYQSDSLFGKWKLNKKPIVIMGSESRPGGRFFNDTKGLLLPIQNQSNGYGFGISLYRLQFKKGDNNISLVKEFFLKSQENTKEFNAGMHQFDIQKIDNKYYYVYDGNRLENNNKKLNIISSLKMNFFDLKNWFYQKF